MIHGFYFRFLGIFHNELICVFLSKLLHSIIMLRFTFLKSFLKKKQISINIEDAHKIIDNIFPDPNGRPKYTNLPVNESVDLSIIIPIFNHVDFIKKNIESVLYQRTKYNYEIILVDDGSTDGARDVVQSYEINPKIKIVCQKNTGIAGARNTGLELAVGKYIMFVDCDDIVHDDIVEVLLNEAFDKDCDMVMCAHNRVKEKNGVKYATISNIYSKYNLYGYKNNDEIMNLAGLPWGKVYKRELWEKIRFFPKYWYEDNIIHFLIFTQCKSYSYIPKVKYEYMWNESNFSHVQGNKKDIRCICDYWLLLAILERYEEIGLPKDGKFYTVLLKHLSTFYYSDIRGMDEEIVEALFVLACEILTKNRINNVKLPYVLKYTERALLNKDINLWKLCSVNQ